MSRLYSALCYLLLVGFSQAADVYLSPSKSFPSQLSLQHAGFVVSEHLGLEPLENFRVENSGDLLGEREFVGHGVSNALFILVDDASIQGVFFHFSSKCHETLQVVPPDIIPPHITRSFSIKQVPSSSITSLVTSYLHLATHAYSLIYSDISITPEGIPRTLDIFSAPTPANEAFLAEISTLFNFAEPSDIDDKFASLKLTGLSQLAATYGRSSEQYQLAARTLKAVLEASSADPKNHIAILTYTPSPILHKRRPQPPQSPLPAPNTNTGPSARRLATCPTTANACSNATNDCFGHGQCVSTINAGRECFVCACSETKSASGKTESWVGEMCEKKDVSR